MPHPTAHGVARAIINAERCDARARSATAPLAREAAARAAERWRRSAGHVLCSWCLGRARYSLWSHGWPERWIGDACYRHHTEYNASASRSARIA